KRLAWLQDKWPAIVRAAKRQGGLILFAEEASFAQWGPLSSTWSRRGHQPEVPTSGKRKGSKVFGAFAYFSRRLFYQGLEGRCNAGRVPEMDVSGCKFLSILGIHMLKSTSVTPSMWRELAAGYSWRYLCGRS